MMEKAKSLLKVMAIWMATSALLALQVGASPPQPRAAGPEIAKRADIIPIDGLKQFGRLERPPVPFLHDKHTTALKQQDQDCAACHLVKDQRYVLKFKRLTDESKPAVMDLYHAECIGCHQQQRSQKLAAGPETCNGCHPKQAVAQSVWQPIALDKSLHYRHVRAAQNQCGTCHHDFDVLSQKLVYKQGQEDSCRFCHRDQTLKNRSSMRLASHRGCISCHQETIRQNKLAGPVQCSGCHDAIQQAEIEVIQDPPRLKRNQPDVTLIQSPPKAAQRDNTPRGQVPAVAFDHQNHELKTNSCRVCHHERVSNCATCHPSQPTEEYNTPLVQAMHQSSATASCVGCHAQQKQQPNCAGCHRAIPASSQLSDNTCGTCHALDIQADVQLDADQKTKVAQQFLKTRPKTDQTLEKAKIPEDIKIDRLEKTYAAVLMPHGKMVRTLLAGINQSRLATVFHNDKNTLCQGCHHGTPATDKPVGCSSCHSAPFNAQDPFKPGLKGAYHQQCMGCHETMKIDKALGCTDCHKKK